MEMEAGALQTQEGAALGGGQGRNHVGQSHGCGGPDGEDSRTTLRENDEEALKVPFL